jgi:lipopolysaccharide export system protein LptC
MNGGNWQHYWFPLLIVGGLVVLTAWLGQLADRRPATANTAALGHNPDYFVDDLRATAYDVAGVPRYHLTASKMVHYMDDDTTNLESPVFLRDGPGVPRIQAESSHGKVSPDGKIVYLIDDVHVTQDSLSGGLPIDLTTQYLKVVPDADQLSTDRPVVLRQGTSVVTGNAMAADGKERTLELSGRVKGLYESHH